MKFKLTMAITGCLLLSAHSAIAGSQTPQPGQSAPFKLTINQISEAEFDEESINNIDFSVNEVKLNGALAAFDAGAGKFIMAGEFRYTQYQFDSDQIDDNSLYEVSMPLTYITGSSTWQHIVNITPGINSDFEDVTEDDFKFSTFYQARYNSSKTLTWVMGLGVGQQFGETQAYPIVGAIYQPNAQWHFNLVLPQLAVNYSASDKSQWYLSVSPEGRTWNVENENKTNDDVDIVMQEIRVVFGAVYGFDNGLAMRAEIGSVTERNLDFTLNNGDEFDLEVKDASFVGISLEYWL